VFIESNDPVNSNARVSFTANVLTKANTAPYTESLNTSIAEAKKNISAKNPPAKKKVLKMPRLSFMEKLHDFGRVPEGKVAQYTFSFVNTGGITLDIGFIVATGQGLATQISSRKIEPGGKGTLTVDFDTSNLQGKVARNIKISSNDPKEPTQNLIIKADIVK
jgi:hypothetical protein